jgi:hypothetical protein
MVSVTLYSWLSCFVLVHAAVATVPTFCMGVHRGEREGRAGKNRSTCALPPLQEQERRKEKGRCQPVALRQPCLCDLVFLVGLHGRLVRARDRASDPFGDFVLLVGMLDGGKRGGRACGPGPCVAARSRADGMDAGKGCSPATTLPVMLCSAFSWDAAW